MTFGIGLVITEKPTKLHIESYLYNIPVVGCLFPIYNMKAISVYGKFTENYQSAMKTQKLCTKRVQERFSSFLV